MSGQSVTLRARASRPVISAGQAVGWAGQLNSREARAELPKRAAPGREPRGHDFSLSLLNKQEGVSGLMLPAPIFAPPTAQVTVLRKIGAPR